jgi:cytoskeleton protein RodZ
MNINELGQLLRTERERRGLTQEDVAHKTKISIYNIRAIEDGRKDALPHPVYAKGFVKNYARLLGLDESELGEVMDREHRVEEDDFGESPAMERPVSMPAKTPAPRKSRLPVVLLLVLLIAALAGLMWYSTTGRQAEEPEIVIHEEPAETPEVREIEEPAEVVEAPQPPPEIEKEPGEEQPAVVVDPEAPAPANATAEDEATEPEAGPAIEPETAVEPEAAPEVEAAAEPEVREPEPASESGFVATVVARELCWVYGRIDNATVTDFTLRPGQSKSVEFRESLTLKLGNAGGVEVFLNGDEYEFEAETGQVKTLHFP